MPSEVTVALFENKTSDEHFEKREIGNGLIISFKAQMIYPLFVCFFVCLLVCLSAVCLDSYDRVYASAANISTLEKYTHFQV